MKNLLPKSKKYAVLKLKKLDQLSYENGVSLYFDAVVLFALGSYSSSLSLVIYAQEELGKSLLFRECTKSLIIDEKTTTDIETMIRKNIFSNHVHKQWFFGMSTGSISRFERFISEPDHLERLKRKALYIDIVNNRINIPNKISIKKELLKQLDYTNRAVQNYCIKNMAEKLGRNIHEKDLVINILDNLFDETCYAEANYADQIVHSSNNGDNILESEEFKLLLEYRNKMKSTD